MDALQVRRSDGNKAASQHTGANARNVPLHSSSVKHKTTRTLRGMGLARHQLIRASSLVRDKPTTASLGRRRVTKQKQLLTRRRCQEVQRHAVKQRKRGFQMLTHSPLLFLDAFKPIGCCASWLKKERSCLTGKRLSLPFLPKRISHLGPLVSNILRVH